uniref:uroporphyrinogen-III synthase n=1 Tax=Ningiella ruwaisensis TaxID=2364274 RepID=UPI0010A01FD3|nr:uroporphyrinogen-III synthase [Ningiella ruwaisensis]
MLLITRPEPKASETQQALLNAGFNSIKQALIQIIPLNVPVFDNAFNSARETQFKGFDLIIITSTYTLDWVKTNADSLICDTTQFLCVGKSCAEHLKAVLFKEKGMSLSDLASRIFIASPENSEGIIAHPCFKGLSSKRVALIKGKGGRGEIEAALKAKKSELSVYSVYKRVSTLNTDDTRPLSSEELASIRCIIITSVDIAKVALDYLPSAVLKRCNFIVASQRIGEFLNAQGFTNIHVSEGASSQAIVNAATRLQDLGV